MTTEPASDRELTAAVDRARGGDTNALGLLYAHYRRPVRGCVAGILRNAEDADDVTQQVFARLGEALTRYEPRSAPFSAWLLRVARNAALDRVRVRATLPLEDVHPAPARDDAAGLERRACLRQALASLPHEQRQVVLMRHLVGLSTPEIAAALGRSEGAVHALHHRGRAGLRRRLHELGVAPAIHT